MWRFLRRRYVVKPERMAGDAFHMIYFEWLGLSLFVERWNTAATASARCAELQAGI